MKKRIVSTMPLISLFLLLVSGIVFDNWWLGFSFILLIPLSTILLSNQIGRQLNQKMPLIALILFLWLWLGLDAAHPGWVVFFLIPLSDTIYHRRYTPRRIVGSVIFFIYIVIGVLYTQSFFPESLKIMGDSFWHPGWLIFLLIPIINNIFFPRSQGFIEFDKERIREKFNMYFHQHRDDEE